MASCQPDPDTFSVRIVSIDYYMSPPITDLDICYSSFQGGKVNEVPVIRIYGSTPAGQKTCLHVHRALPYLYVPCSDISLRTPEEGDMYTREMANAIEKALKSKIKGSSGSKRQHIHGCSLVRGRKFYGYHPSEELFVLPKYFDHGVDFRNEIKIQCVINVDQLTPYHGCNIPPIPVLVISSSSDPDPIGRVAAILVVDTSSAPVHDSYTSYKVHRHAIPSMRTLGYYPHEVARVATLLLGGAVLDTSFQPHESHIPYLLQFLVDYNLFGMGHLHISKMKFRYPLPDNFTRRGIYPSGVNEHAPQMFSCISVDYQADSSADACLTSPVWISSTVPSGWMWPCPITQDSSPNQDLQLIKRQSTCELEGDVTVDEILNQQLKMYSSLSQTGAEVKMVQSLVPIWEEEYQRTGMLEEMICSDPSKPHPGDVLRTLSRGPEVEDALFDLCRGSGSVSSSQVQASMSDDAEKFLQSIKSLADVANLGEHDVHVKLSCSQGDGESLSCSIDENASGSAVSQQSVSKQDDDALCSKSRGGFSELVPGDKEMSTSQNTEVSDSKDIDIEALGLLRWFASSQAAEDVNTDDDIVRDLFLTPLLPKTALSDVLEKANTDYECESQQECQDILDSVDDTTYADTFKEHAIHSTGDNTSLQTSIKKVIPQVVGSCDDKHTGQDGNPSEVKVNSDMAWFSDMVLEGAGTNLSSEQKKLKKVWGSLPLVQQKVKDGSTYLCYDSADGFNGLKSGNYSNSSSGMKVNECSDNALTPANVGSCGPKEGNILNGCSMRDLMRKKRCHRVEPYVEGTCRDNKILRGKEREEKLLNPKRLEFHIKQNGMETILLSGTMESSGSDQHGDPHKRRKCMETSAAQDIRLKSEHFGLHRRPYDVEGVGLSAGSECVPVSDSSLLCTEAKEVPKFLNSLKLENATSDILPRLVFSGEPEFGMRGLRSSPEKNAQEDFSAKKWVSDVCFDSHENCASVEQHKETSLPFLDNSLLTTVLEERRPTKCIEMVFSKKPPTINLMDALYLDTSSTPVVQYHTANTDMNNCEETLPPKSRLLDLGRWSTDEILPFFTDNVQNDGVQCKSYTNETLNFRQDAVLGVPTHYQNDGSCLYLLTTLYTPPSVDCINKWLLDEQLQYDAAGSSGEYVDSRMQIQRPSKCSSLCFVDKENSSLIVGKAVSETLISDQKLVLVDAKHETEPVSCSVAHVKPSVEDLTEDNDMILEKKNSHCCPEARPELFGKGSVVEGSKRVENWQDLSQISGPDVQIKLTPLSQIGFRDSASVGAGQQLTLISIEIHAESRGDLRPDPRFDAVNFIAIVVQEDNGHGPESFVLLRGTDENSCGRGLDGFPDCNVVVVAEEKHLYDHFVKIMRSFDPDVLMGWEIQGGSIGFLAERAANLGVSLLNKISRTPSSAAEALASDIENSTEPVVFEEAIIGDEWGRTHASGVHIGGRIVLNIWRLMRGEVKLNMYTIEAVAEEVLRLKVPLIPFRILTQWFESGPGRARFRCIGYVLRRAQLNLEIMSQLDMINRTSELARVFGIDFFSVLSRGSQYRVESMFLRLAHTQNYLAISPGNQQVASQPAMECLPLVMEPESGFYADPVVVLDFQSLYPSMIIAYNLCFCTCLGKVVPSRENTLGVTSFSPDPHLLMNLKDQILLTPNGVMYVPSKVRKGVLPRLLEEILTTRIMVKRAMKKLKLSQQVLSRIFNARQLALKLIANVTYGYTAAGFSGRMPCAELADSIVQCGRRTLEKAISFVNSHDNWRARVIYGDTDSMFVLLKGRTREEAFKIGQEIASEVSLMNPNPVTLKMEKVYHPCFLLTKKRYVGYSYENPDQAEPSFDAKGIETVRRDSCGAVAKTLEKSLRLFFEHQDISRVKVYLQRQWTRILSGRVSLQDFVFAKEVRLGTYSVRASSLPPAAIVATKAMRADPRAEPHYAERIPYVVIHGEPGARLVDMVVDPQDLLALESPFRLNDLYYINKQIIPALQRAFGLVGADLNQWFMEMPRPVRPTLGKQRSYAPNAQKTRIDYYYASKHCFLCGELVQASTYFCDKCSKNESVAATAVISRTSDKERDIQRLAEICRHCGGGDWIIESGVKCTSLACDIFYQRRKIQKELQSLSAVSTELGLYPKCMVEWF